jgi:hypothetical protein
VFAVVYMRPDLTTRGAGCIIKVMFAIRENSESSLRISGVALHRCVFWEVLHKTENEVVATERDIFRRG